MVLVGLAAEEAVVAVEAALRRPLIERADRRGLGHRRQVPLADRAGVVALRAQHLGQRAGAPRHAAAGAGEAVVPVGETAHADGMVIAPGEEAGARRRAQRGGVKAGVAQARRRERVDGGGRDLGAVAAEVGVADVVEHDDQHVGRAGGRAARLRPPRSRVLEGAAGDAAEDLAVSSMRHQLVRPSERANVDDDMCTSCCGSSKGELGCLIARSRRLEVAHASPRPLRPSSSLAAIASLAAAGCAPREPAPAAAAEKEAAAAPQPTGPASREAYFGDLHIHTQYSFDAFIFNVRATPDDAYKFARGEAIDHPAGFKIQLQSGPLDFAAVTDHSEYLGVMPRSQPARAASSTRSRSRRSCAVRPACRGAKRSRRLLPEMAAGRPIPELYDADVMRTAWSEMVASAERHNEPGKFTTFIGYEYTSAPDMQNLHRNVIFRGQGARPALHRARLAEPRGPVALARRAARRGHRGARHPAQLERVERADVPAGRLGRQSVRRRLRRSAHAQRAAGRDHAGEGHLGDASDDLAQRRVGRLPDLPAAHRHADQERRARAATCARRCSTASSSRRRAASIPSASASSARATPTSPAARSRSRTTGARWARWTARRSSAARCHWTSRSRTARSTPTSTTTCGDRRASPACGPRRTRARRSSTRSAARRPSPPAARASACASSAASPARRARRRRRRGGEGLRERCADGRRSAPVAAGGLAAARRRSARFLVWALRDAKSAPLQRLQVVKGWVENGKGRGAGLRRRLLGRPHARRQPRIAAPTTAPTVELATCKITDGKGAAELRTVWSDPEFDASRRAFYYLRVLENPTCRWSTWDAIRAGVEPSAGARAHHPGARLVVADLVRAGGLDGCRRVSPVAESAPAARPTLRSRSPAPARGSRAR